MTAGMTLVGEKYDTWIRMIDAKSDPDRYFFIPRNEVGGIPVTTVVTLNNYLLKEGGCYRTLLQVSAEGAVAETKMGKLVCSCPEFVRIGEEKGCPHTAETIRHWADTFTIYGKPLEPLGVIEVPLVANCVAHVKCMLDPADSGMHIASMHLPNTREKKVPVGYLVPGEMRAALRTMCKAKLMSFPLDWSCPSSLHNSEQFGNNVYVSAYGLDRFRLLQRWSMLQNGVCFPCFETALSLDD